MGNCHGLGEARIRAQEGGEWVHGVFAGRDGSSGVFRWAAGSGVFCGSELVQRDPRGILEEQNRAAPSSADEEGISDLFICFLEPERGTAVIEGAGPHQRCPAERLLAASSCCSSRTHKASEPSLFKARAHCQHWIRCWLAVRNARWRAPFEVHEHRGGQRGNVPQCLQTSSGGTDAGKLATGSVDLNQWPAISGAYHARNT